MTRIATIDPATNTDPEITEILEWVTQVEGAVPNHFKVELNFPALMKAKLGTTRVLWQMGELSLPEVQHVGIAVSKANGCPYCTAAFCTILNYGLGTNKDYTTTYAAEGTAAVEDARTRTLVNFALKVNADPAAITDGDITGLKEVGLTDGGVVQIIHLVSDFVSYNRLNLALDTDYDYQDMWRQAAFGWELEEGGAEGDNTRGVRD
jgi:uncharacterized peroxidase-related enzyme